MGRAPGKWRPAHKRSKAVTRTPASHWQDWYQTRQWKERRLAFLQEHPFCVDCIKEERPLHLSTANTVDHIVPHRGDEQLFWDESNWQPMCGEHHSRKTASEDGGFGNRRQARA